MLCTKRRVRITLTLRLLLTHARARTHTDTWQHGNTDTRTHEHTHTRTHMYTTLLFLIKKRYVIEGGFDRHCWHREFVVNAVVTGLLFISCCMVSSTGTSLGKQKRMASSISQLFSADTKVKVPGLAVLNAGVAFSWFGLVAMAISLFGSWTKRKSDDGADTAANGLTSYEDGELNSEGVNGGATNIDDGTANNDDCGGSGELNGAAYTSNPEAVLAGDTDAHSI